MNPAVAVAIVVAWGAGLCFGLWLAEVSGLNDAAYRAGSRLRDRWDARRN